MGPCDGSSRITRAVVHHQHVEIRHGRAETIDHDADTSSFVQRRDDHESFSAAASPHGEPVGKKITSQRVSQGAVSNSSSSFRKPGRYVDLTPARGGSDRASPAPSPRSRRRAPAGDGRRRRTAPAPRDHIVLVYTADSGFKRPFRFPSSRKTNPNSTSGGRTERGARRGDPRGARGGHGERLAALAEATGGSAHCPG